MSRLTHQTCVLDHEIRITRQKKNQRKTQSQFKKKKN